MANTSIFYEDNAAPYGLWSELYDKIRDKGDHKVVSISGYEITYGMVDSAKNHYYSRSGRGINPIRYWISEFEEKGHVACYEDNSIILFERNLPPFIRPCIGLRFMLLGRNPPFEKNLEGLRKLCKLEIDYILKGNDSNADIYRRWLLDTKKKEILAPSEIITHIFPAVMEVFEHDPRSSRKLFQDLSSKLESNLQIPPLFEPKRTIEF